MRKSSLTVILIVAAVDMIGYGLIIPLLPTYAKRLNATALTLGCLVGSYALMQLVFNPVLGRWSDRIGRRPVLLVSIGGSVISHALLGVADWAQSLPLLFAARILDGITGANIATVQAYIADVTSAENRARGMGLFGAAFGVGFVLGPGLAAALFAAGRWATDGVGGSAWPAFGAASISLISLIVVWWQLPESRVSTNIKPTSVARFSIQTIRAVIRRPRLLELFGLYTTCIFAFCLLEVTFVYLSQDLLQVDLTTIGLMFAYIGVLIVIVQGGLVGPLVRRFGEPTLVATGPFITALGMTLIALTPAFELRETIWLLLGIGCVPIALGNGLIGPSINALISRQAGPEKQGEILGLAQGAASLSRAVAPPIGGALYDGGASRPYLLGAALFVIVGIVALVVQPRQLHALAALPDPNRSATG